MPAQFSNVTISPPSAIFVEANKSENLDNFKLASVSMEQQHLSKNQKRRQNKKQREINIANKSSISTESNVALEIKLLAEQNITATLNFDRLKAGPRKSVIIKDGQRMASNDEFFLICPKNKLCLYDVQGKEQLNIKRDFNVSDICWSTYLKTFLILSDSDLYSLDLTRSTPLMIEISGFGRDMDECTCYDNIFMVISDFGGEVIEVWDMNMNWKSIRRYESPISREEDQGISSIRFSSSGMYLGVTLTEPFIEKAYFQLRNWQDMKVLQIVEQPFYEGYCNHYMLALPNDEFLVYKYSEKEIFFFNSNGQLKQRFQYSKRICSTALLMNDKNCLVIQTSRPDELHFYDL
ncbi:unnamed protein product [Adineta steineri]|uniref:Uncharacterized protein n=1 Tax=Adineta steineri TaxID=433720 RepID=A0A819NCV6_9BILA|nr:unnamed protein product [Adineta steineri]CAF3991665.1 unnamed protein product [Adineta steineri]